MSKISIHFNSVLRHRHTLGEGCQQPDLLLIELDTELVEVVEMRRFILQYNFEQLLILMGQLVYAGQIEKGESQIDLSDLDSGTYFALVGFGRNIQKATIIITK